MEETVKINMSVSGRKSATVCFISALLRETEDSLGLGIRREPLGGFLLSLVLFMTKHFQIEQEVAVPANAHSSCRTFLLLDYWHTSL